MHNGILNLDILSSFEYYEEILVVKRLILFALIAVSLLTSCKSTVKGGKGENTLGELVVNNQSSVQIREIKYCGKQLRYQGDGTDSTGSVLPVGKKTSVELADEESGYVFFTLLNEKWDVLSDVRTNEIITVEKGKKFILTITDNTLVVKSGGKDSSTLLNLAIPATLKIENRSSVELYDVKYKEVEFSDYSHELGLFGSETHDFYGITNFSDCVYFRLYDKNLRTSKKVSISNGMVTSFIIDDDLEIIRNGRDREIKLSELQPQGFEVINNTSYDLYDVRFSSDYAVLHNKDILKKGSAWYVGFDDYGYSVVVIFKIRTSTSEKEFLSFYHPILAYKTRDILFTDDTEVRYPNGDGGKLANGLD